MQHGLIVYRTAIAVCACVLMLPVMLIWYALAGLYQGAEVWGEVAAKHVKDQLTKKEPTR
jgi:hypothetical protein